MSFTSAPADAAQDPSPERWGDVYLASAARGVSACGDFLAATALVLTLQARGAGGMAVAALLLASTVPLVLLGTVAGRIADRVDSRVLLFGVAVIQAVAALALAFTSTPALMIGLVAVLAGGLAVTSPALGALIPAMVRPAGLPKATAISQTANSLGVLAGPALAGILVGQFGVRVPLLIDAASYLAIAVAALFIRTRRGGRSAPATSIVDSAGMSVAVWSMRRDRLLFALVIAIAITIAAVTAVNVVDVFFIRETLHASETAYGLIGAVWTAGMLGGAWLAVRGLRTARDGRVATVLMVMLGLTCAILGISAGAPHVWWLVPLWIVGGVTNGWINVGSNVILVRRVPAAVRGRVVGTFVATVNAANVLGYLAGGVLLGFFEPRVLLAACGTAGVLAVLACIGPVIRAARREPPQVTEPAPAPVAAPAHG